MNQDFYEFIKKVIIEGEEAKNALRITEEQLEDERATSLALTEENDAYKFEILRYKNRFGGFE